MVEDPATKTMQDMEAMLEEVMIMMDNREPNWSKRKHLTFTTAILRFKVKLTFMNKANVRQNVTLADKEIKRLLGSEKCKGFLIPDV